MSASVKTARVVGVLYIVGTAAGVLSAVLAAPILEGPDYLVKTAANTNQLMAGALLVLVMGFALAMVPVVLFPILKKHNQALALGAVVFRGALEAVAYIAIAISWLLLIALSQEHAKAGAPDGSYFQALGTLLLRAVDSASQILAIVFSIGALMIYYLFYRSKLIPRWLSVWGLVGGVCYFAVPLLGMFGTVVEVLYAPLAVQEMVLAVWLIVKGFHSSAITTEAAEKA